MPNITVELLRGRSLDQRRRFVEALTEDAVKHLGARRQDVPPSFEAYVAASIAAEPSDVESTGTSNSNGLSTVTVRFDVSTAMTVKICWRMCWFRNVPSDGAMFCWAAGPDRRARDREAGRTPPVRVRGQPPGHCPGPRLRAAG